MEFNIKPITPLPFLPTILIPTLMDVTSELIETEEGTEEVKFINVKICLKQFKTLTTIVEEGIIKIPFTEWTSIIIDYDPEKKEPVFDTEKFNLLLKNFNLTLNNV